MKPMWKWYTGKWIVQKEEMANKDVRIFNRNEGEMKINNKELPRLVNRGLRSKDYRRFGGLHKIMRCRKE